MGSESGLNSARTKVYTWEGETHIRQLKADGSVDETKYWVKKQSGDIEAWNQPGGNNTAVEIADPSEIPQFVASALASAPPPESYGGGKPGGGGHGVGRNQLSSRGGISEKPRQYLPTGASTAPQMQGNSPEQTRATQEKVIEHLMNRHKITRAQAAGIVGNLNHESGGMNPGIVQGNTFGNEFAGEGIGLAQWSGQRKKEYLEFCGPPRNLAWNSLEANLQFLDKELDANTGSENAATKIMLANPNMSAAEAAQVFFDKFERCGNDGTLSSRTATAVSLA